MTNEVPDPAEVEAALEAGRLLFAGECRFLISALEPAQLPDLNLPEIAFAGRSNVGKSSLVNALTGHNALARTSNTPGRTQLLNFFDLSRRLVLVDLPGYGYAKVSRSKVERWTGLTLDYLKGRRQLKRVCLLIDSRHGLKDKDRSVMEILDKAAVSYQIVLTKVDKLRGQSLATVVQRTEEEARRHPAAHPEIMQTSSAKGTGIAELRAVLAKLANPDDKQ